jgi:signal transduction histidine kinase
VAGIAHEMNTPLGNALLAANALQAQSAALQGQLAAASRSSARR